MNKLKKQLQTSKLSMYRIAKESGVAQSVLSRFVRGHTNLSWKNQQKLNEFFKNK